MTGSRLIHVVDDDEAVRKSAMFLLRRAGFTVRPWASGGALLEEIDTDALACILLDMRMPPPDGLAVQRELARRGSLLPVIVFSGHGDLTIIIQALQAGAADFIEKPFERSLLLAAIEGAFRRMEDPMEADRQKEAAMQTLAILDDEERLMLEKLASGWTNDRVARSLGYSPHQIELRRARVFNKLGISGLPALVRIALAAELVDL